MKIHYNRFLVPITICSFILFLGWASDPPDGNTGAPFDGLCTGCHSGGSYDGIVAITGFPSSITPNTTYPITITATATMGSPVLGGFQLVCVNASNVNAGNLTAGTGSGTSFFNSREYLDHRGPKAYSGGSVSWNFDWTSPNGPNGAVITMYFSHNMANGNSNSSGDKIIFDSQSGTMIGGGVPLTVNVISKKNVSCNGGNDGEATASAGGGNPPYTYAWSNGDMINKATMLFAGTYRVTATDENGTTATATTSITQPPVLVHELKVVKNVTCPGGKDGSILATANGGTAPYSFIYSSGSPNNLIAGIYSVTVSDANSCTVTSSVVVTEPDTFSINPVVFDNPSCPVDSNGQIGLMVSGANPPYKYLWSSGETTSQIVNKKVGTYRVTITDNKNCNAVRGYELKSTDNLPPALIAKNSKVYLNETGKAVPKISDYLIQNIDNCDPAPALAINIDTFRCSHLGKKNYIISSTDLSGNKAMDTIEIEVLDTLKPVIQVWQDTSFKRCDIVVPAIAATDNCSITEFKKLSGPDAGTLFPPGVTVITYSAKDASGNETIDSFKTEIILPVHYTIDSFYFNICTGDTAFTQLSINHDFDLPMHFYYLKDTTKVLADSSFTIKTSILDTINFFISEESGCVLEYKKEVTYPGIPLKLDSVKITHSGDIASGIIEVYITGTPDSISWYDANTNTYINNTGLNLPPGDYIVKAYFGPCEFNYGPYKVNLIISTTEATEINLKVYPMPFTNEINILSDYKSELQFALLNAHGATVHYGKFTTKLILDGNTLQNGIYFLRCSGTKKSNTIRLIKI